MAIEISTAFVILVLPITLAENGYIGYNYHEPVLPHQMPTNQGPSNLQQPSYNDLPEVQSGFIPAPGNNQYYSSGDVYRNHHLQTQHTFHYNNQRYHNTQSTFSYQNGNHDSITPVANNGNLIRPQNPQQNIEEGAIRNPIITYTRPQPPIITKHIYFHLPPPDIMDNVPSVTSPPAKKTYNIIFIKLPSQKSSSAARLQHIINQQSAEKTLIYVLVKKPEAQHLQNQVTSKPEVFYVKYKEPRNV